MKRLFILLFLLSSVASAQYFPLRYNGTLIGKFRADSSFIIAQRLLMAPYGTSAGNTGAFGFQELAANGVNYTGFKAPDALSANVVYTLPTGDGSNGQFLRTNGSGVLSWATAAGGGSAFLASLTGSSTITDSVRITLSTGLSGTQVGNLFTFKTDTSLVAHQNLTHTWTGTYDVFQSEVHLDRSTYIGNTLASPGSAPFFINGSLTGVVTNLNADRVDGYHASGTPGVTTVPVSDGSGLLDSWISTATTSTKGLASFSSSYFGVSSGVVSFNPSASPTFANLTLSQDAGFPILTFTETTAPSTATIRLDGTSNHLNFGQGAYFSDNGTFSSFNAMLSVYKTDTASHVGYSDGIYTRVYSRGDSGVTNQGAIGEYTVVIEDTLKSGLTGRKRGTLFAHVTNLLPITENYPYIVNRDVAAELYANVGLVEATSVFYVGGSRHMAATTGNPNSRQWRRMFELDDTVGVLFDLNGGAEDGLDLSGMHWLGSTARAVRTTGVDTSVLGYVSFGTTAHPLHWLSNYQAQPSLALTSTGINKNLSTDAQVKDSGSIVFDFSTNTYKPRFLMTGVSGDTTLFIDTLGNMALNYFASNITPYASGSAVLTAIGNTTSNARGAIELGTEQTLVDGTVVGDIGFFGMANSSGQRIGLIRAAMSGTTSGNRGSEMRFFTKADAGSIAQAMVIDRSGSLGIGDGTPLYMFTVGSGDLFGVNSSGLIPKYNGIATVNNGIPSELATVNLTAQSAAVSTTTLYAVPASGAGQYRVSWNAKVTTAATTSSTLGALTIVYTDPDGVAQTITCGAQTNAGAVATTSTGNTTTTVLVGLPMKINCKASTNITYAFAYASSGGTAMQYNLNILLEKL